MTIPARPWRFRIANAAVWSLYGLVSVAMARVFAGVHSSGIVLVSVLLAVLLCVASGALRTITLRRRWLERDAGPLALRLLGLVAALAALVQLLIQLALAPALRMGWVDFPAGMTSVGASAVVGYWINTAIVLGLWTFAWAGRRALARARASELATLRAESERRTLELDALRARLNPHFVFNALNNLRALILEDPERARELVTRLSNTLRHALDHSQREWTTLREELDVVRDHLAVEQVHYEDRLRPRLDIDPAALDARVPPMALQLLVENAIKHGIARTAGGGALGVRASRAGDVLRIEVDNPGRIESQDGSTGVGLAFLRHRLQRTGGRVDLGVDDQRVRAVLEIPQ